MAAPRIATNDATLITEPPPRPSRCGIPCLQQRKTPLVFTSWTRCQASTEVGRSVMEGAAATIKRVTLELGGKSANVVFADADLERAAALAPAAVFGNAGQDCCARSRILIQKVVYDRFLHELVDTTSRLRV